VPPESLATRTLGDGGTRGAVSRPPRRPRHHGGDPCRRRTARRGRRPPTTGCRDWRGPARHQRRRPEGAAEGDELRLRPGEARGSGPRLHGRFGRGRHGEIVPPSKARLAHHFVRPEDRWVLETSASKRAQTKLIRRTSLPAIGTSWSAVASLRPWGSESSPPSSSLRSSVGSNDQRANPAWGPSRKRRHSTSGRYSEGKRSSRPTRGGGARTPSTDRTGSRFLGDYRRRWTPREVRRRTGLARHSTPSRRCRARQGATARNLSPRWE
jgi:hypothetical protein